MSTIVSGVAVITAPSRGVGSHVTRQGPNTLRRASVVSPEASVLCPLIRPTQRGGPDERYRARARGQASVTQLAAGGPRGRPLRRCSVRINDERCVIPGVVLRAKTWRAVVATAGSTAARWTCQRWLGRLRRTPHERERPGVPLTRSRNLHRPRWRTQAPASSPLPSLRTARGPARRRCGCVSGHVLAGPSGR